MATTAVGNPYVESSDLVANYPGVSETLAERIDVVGVNPFADAAARTTAIPSPVEGQMSSLADTDSVERYNGSAWVAVGPGKILQVESAILTSTQTASVGAGASVAITSLTITHTLASATNKLLLTGYVGAVASSSTVAAVGVRLADNGTAIGVGDAAGSRSQVGAGGQGWGSGTNAGSRNLFVSFLYSPGDTSSHTYTLNAVNTDGNTHTVYINRSVTDANDAGGVRTASSLTLMEVSV